jgi:hypothetical protein
MKKRIPFFSEPGKVQTCLSLIYIFPFMGIVWGMICLHVIRGLAWVAREINQAMLSDRILLKGIIKHFPSE